MFESAARRLLAFCHRELGISIGLSNERAKRDDYSFYYHAPTLVVVTNRRA